MSLVSSNFCVDISSGLLKITSLGFLSLWMLVSNSPTHFVFISFSSFSISFLLLLSIRTNHFLSNLKVLIPKFSSFEFILVLRSNLIVSGGLFDVVFTDK